MSSVLPVLSEDAFTTLSTSTRFEDITIGRKGAILVEIENELIPIVRTTTRYSNPVQKFLPIHKEIVSHVRDLFSSTIAFNNAIIEMYDSRYRTMKYHSDQALDLAEDSLICIYSCYEDELSTPRKLKIKDKITNVQSELILHHNSVVLFSTATNKRFLHKIVLESSKGSNDSNWLGITFRLSKTFIRFVDELPLFYPGGDVLRLGDADEIKEFHKQRSLENKSVDFVYPSITYTISTSDAMSLTS